MTDLDEYDDAFGPDPVHAVRSEAERRGYYTHGTARVRLGVERWQWQVAEWNGVLPQATATERSYVRWPYDLIEQIRDELRERIVTSAGVHPPLGAFKLAALLSTRTTLDVQADDVRELVRLGELAPIGKWYDADVFDVRDLSFVDLKLLRRVVDERPRRLRQRQTIRRDQVEKMMGIRTADLGHVVRRGLLTPVSYERAFYRGQTVNVPYFRASDVDDLLAGPIDWRAIGETPKGRRSPLAGDDQPPTKADRAQREALIELARRHAEEFEELVRTSSVYQSIDTTGERSS